MRAAVSPPAAGFVTFGAGQNAVCSALNYSCYWMINAATQLNMEPITVSARQHVHVCVSPWLKFAALSCRVNALVHILVMGCNFSNSDTVSERFNVFLVQSYSWKTLYDSVTSSILRTANIWQKF